MRARAARLDPQAEIFYQRFEDDFRRALDVARDEIARAGHAAERVGDGAVSVRALAALAVAPEQFAVNVAERLPAVSLPHESQVVQERDQHPFVVDESSASRPTALRRFRQRDFFRATRRPVRVVLATERVQVVLKGQLTAPHGDAQRLVVREAFIEPVVLAVEHEAVRNPQVEKFVRQ